MQNKRYVNVLAFVAIFMLLPMANSKVNDACAAFMDWKNIPYSHSCHEEGLGQLLRDFFANQGINVIISKEVNGVVSGDFKNVAPDEFFEAMVTSFGLVYYFDGSILYIYGGEEIDSKIIETGGMSAQEFIDTLTQLAIFDPRYPVRFIPDKGIAMVSGPKRMVELIAETATILAARVSRKTQAQTVRLFQLKYAWADDQTFSFMDKEVVVPGVATILSKLLAGQGLPVEVTGKQEKQLARALPKLKGTGLSSKGAQQEAHVAPQSAASEPSDKKTAEAQAVSVATIQADTRLNAVIIKDIQERMSFYEEIINALDVPAGLVQIEASIIEIDSDYFRELGIDWRVQTGSENSNIKTSGGFNAAENLVSGNPLLFTGDGLNFSTILGNAGEYFLTKVKALEKNGKAKIYSKPQVLTIDNVEALLEHSRTFYVRVQGTEEVDLYNVTAGIALKVTPHIIEEGEGKKIKMTIKIEDGSILETQVDNIPVVAKSSITTQAIIHQGESLLIGGYIQKQETEASSAIPFIHKVPVVGNLFKTPRKQFVNNERVFLITPRIVNYDDKMTVATENVQESLSDHVSEKTIVDTEEDRRDLHSQVSMEGGRENNAEVKRLECSVISQASPAIGQHDEQKPAMLATQQQGLKMFYTLQVASLTEADAAQAELQKYQSIGYEGMIKRIYLEDGKAVRYRIYLGSFASKQQAEEKAAEFLHKTGKKPLVLLSAQNT